MDFRMPPIESVGSVSAARSTSETIEVVVVLPWVPLMAMAVL